MLAIALWGRTGSTSQVLRLCCNMLAIMQIETFTSKPNTILIRAPSVYTSSSVTFSRNSTKSNALNQKLAQMIKFSSTQTSSFPSSPPFLSLSLRHRFFKEISLKAARLPYTGGMLLCAETSHLPSVVH